ncbi:hypothetical protein E2320_016872 [Naja naja]|nr:hypothetical protein E2320_016872 [Naja naja]
MVSTTSLGCSNSWRLFVKTPYYGNATFASAGKLNLVFGKGQEEARSNQGFMHMKLAKTKEKYILGQNSPPFDSVPEVIHYYTAKKLPIKGAEHLSLLYPVAVRTL